MKILLSPHDLHHCEDEFELLFSLKFLLYNIVVCAEQEEKKRMKKQLGNVCASVHAVISESLLIDNTKEGYEVESDFSMQRSGLDSRSTRNRTLAPPYSRAWISLVVIGGTFIVRPPHHWRPECLLIMTRDTALMHHCAFFCFFCCCSILCGLLTSILGMAVTNDE